MEVEELKNPAWVDAGKAAINCDVKFSGIDSFIPFTASANDTELHGRQLFAELMEGKYGKISPFTPDISALKLETKERLTADYNQACQQDVQFTTAGGITQTFQADTGSQQLLQASIAGLSGTQQTPPEFVWLALDNTPVPFTYADLQGLAETIYLQGYQAFVRLQELKAQLRTTSSEAEINALAW